MKFEINLNQTQQKICEAIIEAGGRPMVVGGMVRDMVMNRVHNTSFDSKDFDVEVFGMTQVHLNEVLSQFGVPETSGNRFAVTRIAVNGEQMDFSIPRRDEHGEGGHNDLVVTQDPNMSFEEATSRRDFTFNAMMWDVRDNVLVDMWHGVEDIRNRIIRHVSSDFSRDILRPSRAFQFAGRFGFTVAQETVELCRAMVSRADTLTQNGIRQEVEKWATKSVQPSNGLRFLEASGWLEVIFPEVQALVGVPQDEIHHPEGDVFEHTCHVVDAVAHQTNDMVLMLAGLAHDVGKAVTTERNAKGRWSAIGHEVEGVAIARQMIDRWWVTNEQKSESPVSVEVGMLTRWHMCANDFGSMKQTKKESLVRRVSCDVNLERLSIIVNADKNGRPFNANKFAPDPEMIQFMEVANNLSVATEKPKQLVNGRDLIAIGWSPSPKFGQVLRQAFQAQLDGEFDTTEAGMQWLRERGIV